VKPIGYLVAMREIGPMLDILICGDIFRANLELTHRPYNTRWFSALIRKSIDGLGIASEVLGHCPPNFNFERFYKSIYGQAGIEVLDKWAELYDAAQFDGDTAKQLFDIFSGKLVILFEGSRSILNYITSIGGTYLNFRVSPLRFGSDLVFLIQTNNKNVQQAIQCFEIDRSYVDAEIAALRTQMGPETKAFARPTLVFLGQVPGDASLINEGRFKTIAVPQSLDTSGFAPKDIFHKPHPIDDNAPEMSRWKTLFPSSQVLDMPTYAAFCSQGDLTFITVSSGSGYEAQLLGHECHFVSPHNWSVSSPRWKSFTPVLFEYWFEDFWRSIFMALHGQSLDEESVIASKKGMVFVPEKLRNTIAAKWAEPNGRSVGL
jgi:hypothetical protein